MLVLGAWLAHTLVCNSAYQQFLQFPTSFLSILGAPGWETTCLLGPSFWCMHVGIGGPHTKVTLAINMKCAKPYGFLMKLCYCLATCHCHSNQHFELWAATCTSVWGLTTYAQLGGTSWD